MEIPGIYSEIYSSLESDLSSLPVLPEITLTIREKLNSPNCTNNIAANLLKSDPGLAAFIMRTSNSARYLLRHPPSDLESAVLRLGLSTTLSLATTYTTRSMFTETPPSCKALMRSGYKNATKVAVLSYFLADKIRGFDSGKAMLSGLLQDIALPLLLSKLVKRPEVFNDKQKLMSAIDQLSPLVNVLVLKQWGFDKEMISVVHSRKQWLRDENKDLDLADIVLIARWHSLMGTAEFTACPALPEIPAFSKLPPEYLTAGNSLQLLADSQQEISQLQKVLCIAA